MAYINYMNLKGLTLKDEYEFISRKNRHLLLKNRSKHYHYLIDKMVLVNPDLQELLNYVRTISEKWYSTIKGSLVGLMLVRYTHYFLYPQQYAHRGDLILFINYFLLQQYLFRIVGVLKHNYHMPKDKYFKFKIKKDKLYKLSELFLDEMSDVVISKLVPHYQKLHDFD